MSTATLVGTPDPDDSKITMAQLAAVDAAATQADRILSLVIHREVEALILSLNSARKFPRA